MITERVATSQTFLRQRLDTLHRSLQYNPWFIKLSTLDRRLLIFMLIAPILVLLLIIILATSTSSSKISPDVFGPRGLLYRGELSTTVSGLECVPWDQLDRTVHTVTLDRYPQSDLAGHNHCRNPDSEETIWCYTDLSRPHFDYCHVPGQPARLSPNSGEADLSCPANITVVVGTGYGSSASGSYGMTRYWTNGRGLYAKLKEDGNFSRDHCISWHGQYRHWWLQSCNFVGNNGGIGWLEEDARCPDQGITWRRGGTDAVMNHTFVTTRKCMEFGRQYNGTIVPGGLGDSQHTDTALECQGLCWRTRGCQAFTWLRGNNNPCYLYHTVAVAASQVNSRAVSGLASCQEKVKVGCPGSDLALGPDICVRFLTSSCTQGCSRYTAMELCELSGGYLLEVEDKQQLLDLLQATAGTEHGISFWWTGGIDISKKSGEFVWERSNQAVASGAELWQNSTSNDVVGVQGGRGHQCVLLGPANNTLDLRLDHADCSEAIARPLCQYLIK